jgi:hypothetical protein
VQLMERRSIWGSREGSDFYCDNELETCKRAELWGHAIGLSCGDMEEGQGVGTCKRGEVLGLGRGVRCGDMEEK